MGMPGRGFSGLSGVFGAKSTIAPDGYGRINPTMALKFLFFQTNVYTQAMPWDPMVDYKFMKKNTEDFMSLWHSYKPTIARVHGYAAAGGSDIATCCDFIVMEDKARIGYIPVRVWVCPIAAMWVYRLGAMRAKRMMLTGDLIDDKTAFEWGLATDVAPLHKLDAAVNKLADRIAGLPKNQLMMLKLVINQAVDNMAWSRRKCLPPCLTASRATRPRGCGSSVTRKSLVFRRRWSGATADDRCRNPALAARVPHS